LGSKRITRIPSYYWQVTGCLMIPVLLSERYKLT
jgi:hypothetical protein